MKKEIDPFDDTLAEGDAHDEGARVSNRSAAGLLRVALERWWLILIFMVLGYVGALYYLSVKEPETMAMASLKVTTKQQLLVGNEVEQDSMVFRDQMLGTIAAELVGLEQLQKVMQRPEVQVLEKVIPPQFSWKPKYWRDESQREFISAGDADPAEFLRLLHQRVSVENVRGTTLIAIKVTHPDAETAKTLANAVMMTYVEEEEARISGGTSDAFKVVSIEADEIAAEMEAAERSFQTYRAALELNQELNTFRSELSAFRQRYKSKHPRLIEAEAIYQDLYRRFRLEIETAARTGDEVDYWKPLMADVDRLDKQIASAESEADRRDATDRWLSFVQNKLSSRASVLESRIGSLRGRYETFTRRLAEIDVADDEGVNSKVRVNEAATIPPPSKYKHLITLAAGSVLGGGVGVGLVFLLSLMDYKIYDVRSAEEATGLPCLAAIPLSSAVDSEDGEWRSISSSDPNTVHAESIRNLRASITLLGRKENNKVLVVTSAMPGEGKTTTAAELAELFALEGERTVLIDFDLRKPRVHELYPKLKGQPGTVDVLIGHAQFDDVVAPTRVEGLFVVPSGKKPPNPLGLLQPDEIMELVDEASKEFDRVIIDSPPVLPVSDTRLVAQHAHKVILVVRALKTPVGAVLRAKDLLLGAKLDLAGVVVNALKARHSGSGYFGYRDYGEYGHDSYYGQED
ncbi:polysaccharide biosynthesis tyrosine autokinase [Sulfuriroseicoccus oceanibius]|uniref:Polysaccharide biosynthesis tyrosine autokinase n=1 Tax=Sulfuriroseicoccus oceanibius TaxID=2707525 RepID=A0A6B3L936_9BACT|nr:tyrosine-protein kinase domain-containing protein [Sulfuriroseicoccus oceanibius]QQL44322.1 polysaccharide biosynthesis tyrosine autokinase [Sulfuriroseicoccus oceanibius]